MLSGFQGVKYGLTVPKKDSKAAPKKALAAFAEDDSDDDQEKVANAIERQALRKQSDHKVAKMQAAALEEDPSIFDYDSHFDAQQDQRAAAKPSGPAARKSRYIESLLDKTKERQREQDIIYERKLLRERKAEDHLFGDKDKFVTAAYKKKLEEDQKWLEEEAIKDKVEEEEDVRKRGHMGDFYRNLLTKNVDFGGAQPSKAKPTAAAKPPPEAPPSSSQPPQQGDPKWEEMRRAREAYEEKLARAGGGPSTEGGEDGSAAAAVRGSSGTADVAVTQQPQTDASHPTAPKPNTAAEARTKGAAEGAPSGGSTVKAEESEPAMSKEDKAAAARERFLARKRKAPA